MDMCYLACVYRTPSGYCGSTGGVATCQHRQKKHTNADKLRAMSDEELAEYFTQFYYDGPKFYCPAVADVGEGACAANYDCRECWLKWLKQEEQS